MTTTNRGCNDKLYDCTPYSFRPMLKNGTNPVHNRMPVKIRLKHAMNWMTPDRSDEDQRLTVKFLVDWTEALLTDLATHPSYSEHVTRGDLLMGRAKFHNVLVSEQSWDAQIEAQRAADKLLRAYCVHPSVHADTIRGSVKALLKHKAECWNSGDKN